MEFKSLIEEVLKKGTKNNVYFVGCGASKADLYPAFYFVSRNSNIKTGHLTANEFNYDTPKDIGESSIVISASLGGTTPETVEATKKARSLGATTICLTNDGKSPIAEAAEYPIVHGFHANYGEKLEKMQYCLQLAVEIVNQIEGVEHYDKFQEGFAKVAEVSEKSAKAAKNEAIKFAQSFKEASPIYVLGSGPNFEAAYATSLCLLLEMQWIDSASIHSGEFFHGALEITDKDVPFLVFMADGKTRKLDERLLEFLLRFDANVSVIDGKDYALSSEFDPEVVDYFNPLILSSVMRVYAEELAEVRGHSLSKRRYMWKLNY